MLDGGDVGGRWRGGGKVGGGVVEKRLGGEQDVEFEVFAALNEVRMIESCG